MSRHLYDSDIDFPTLVDLLRWRGLYQKNQRAYTYLVDGETEQVHLTYGELDRQARTIGAWLQSFGAIGKRVLLLYPPGLDYIAAFFGCLYAGAIAIPTYPPRRKTLPRLQAIAADAQATLALTTAQIRSTVESLSAQGPDLKTLKWLVIDNVMGDLADNWQEPAITSDTLAFLQYTSGSTGTPKGVMLSHGNLIYNQRMIHSAFKNTERSICVSWLPFYHDMGLIGNLFQPLYVGFPCVLMAPFHFLQRPMRWLHAISRYKATISGGPNFAYDLCVRKITPEQRTTLDLSSWNVAFNGAEPVRYKTLEQFAAAFGPCGFRREAFCPCYGLAEATLMVSGCLKDSLPAVYTIRRAELEENRVVEAPAENENTQTLVGCGETLLDQDIVIVRPESFDRSPPGEVGEIWVSGSNVAQGYWNRQEETEHTFRGFLKDRGEIPFLRTGDLGFIKDRELFVTGRLKDLVIIRGRNYYPQDIESTVEQSHPALRSGCGAVFSVEVDDEEHLVVVQELEFRQHPQVNEVIECICQSVFEEYEVQVYAIVLIKPGSIPKTSSGKIQRQACRMGFLAKSFNVVGEWTLSPKEGEQNTFFGKSRPDQQAVLLKKSQNTEAVQAWLVSHIAKRLKVNPDDIDIRKPFTSYGLDSMAAVGISGELEDWLGYRLSPSLVYEYPNIKALARHLTRKSNVLESTIEVAAGREVKLEPIAIIGIGCRFPGARGPDAFWRLLRDGIDAITEVPVERWDLRTFYDPNPMALGKMNTRWGGFLEKIDQFDHQFFGISPQEARGMDPQQRLLLEVAWEALEDAGQVAERLTGTRTGVFIGISSNDYGQIQLNNPGYTDPYWCTGNALSIAANRLSYLFDFRGPSLAVDTACSSSLVAVHLACHSLWNGESTIALAGGVNLILSPAITINFSQVGATSPDGRCKAFDAQANGLVRGEGCGIVVLKPLSRALSEGDPIYAVIRGSAVNQDGSTNGLTAPSRSAQENVLREAYQIAGVSPGQVQYIEAHGTGTLLGDPIEAKALGTVLAIDRSSESPCAVGSVKTNIGHLEAAAGIAGLIKVALSLKYRKIPPSLHFREPNPYIPFDKFPLRVQQNLGSWNETSGPILAGVSAFGFGGTNAHVVLEEAVNISPSNQRYEEITAGRSQLLPLSAHSPEALDGLARAYKEFLPTETSESAVSLQDVCYTASVKRAHHNHRLSIVFRSREELAEGLDAFLKGESRPGISSGSSNKEKSQRIVFIFSGQGAHWRGKGLQLFDQEPVFRRMVEKCDELLHQYESWSLLEELTANEVHSSLNSDEIGITQIALFTLQVAQAALWLSWGIRPDAVVGHSMGEVAAAYVAGALSLSQAFQIIFHRSSLMQRGLQNTTMRGAMAVVKLSMEDSEQALLGYEDRLSIASHNSPVSTVLSGEEAALNEVLQSLKQRKIPYRLLRTHGAGHSPQMEALRNKLVQVLQGLEPQPESIKIYSTITGKAHNGEDFNPDYWGRNIREPVLFSEAINGLALEGHNIFLEISLEPILLSAVSQCLRHCGREGTVLPSLHRNLEERDVMLSSIGTLYTLGYPLDWSRLYLDGGRYVRLPSYPWQRKRFWIETERVITDSSCESAFRDLYVAGRHPLLGRHLKPANLAGSHFWEFELERRLLPYMDDHRVQGVVLFSSAVYIEMILAAVAEALGEGPCILKEFEIRQALFLTESTARTIQIILSHDASRNISFHIYSRPGNNNQTPESWILHVTGIIHHEHSQSDTYVLEQEIPEKIKSRCTEKISGKDFYAVLHKRGLEYGPSFRGIEHLWRCNGEALGKLRIPRMIENEVEAYCLHPAILDASLQVLLATVSFETPGESQAVSYLPVGADQIRFYGLSSFCLWSYARLHSNVEDNSDSIAGDVQVFDDRGEIVAEILGFRVQHLEREMLGTFGKDLRDWLYELRWQSIECPGNQQAAKVPQPEEGGSWLIFADKGGVGKALKALLEKEGEHSVLVSLGEAYKCLEKEHFLIHPDRPEDIRQLLEEALGSDTPACRGIIHLLSLDAPPMERITVSSLEAAQTLGCESVMNLVQQVARMRWSEAPCLWLVTQGSQFVEEKPFPPAVSQAPLWGLGRTIAQEHPMLWGGLIDLDQDAPTEVLAAHLYNEILYPDGEDQIAYRNGQRYVARLARKHELSGNIPPLVFRVDATYLITGGLGDLGFVVARWMVDRGARRLILLGRTKLPSRSKWKDVEKGTVLEHKISSIRELEALGASVHPVCVDVGDEVRLASFLKTFDCEGWPPIRGVVHMAGVVHGGMLLDLDTATLRADFRPKGIGAWLLNRLMEKQPLDFFLLFSSGAALLSSPFLGGYAAANAFMDSLAHYRRALGRPALSINWGFWAEAGMAVQHLRDYNRNFLPRGMLGITDNQGLEILGRLLQQDSPQVAVLPFNWSEWCEFHPAAAKAPLLADLLSKKGQNLLSKKGQTIVKGGGPGLKSSLNRDAFINIESKERQRLLESYLSEHLVRICGSSLSNLSIHQNLSDLGIDSLMAIELKNRIEEELEVIVPVVQFLQGPTISQLAAELNNQLTVKVSTPTMSPNPTALLNRGKQEPGPYKGAGKIDVQQAADLLDKFDQLSDDQVDSLLNSMLDGQEDIE